MTGNISENGGYCHNRLPDQPGDESPGKYDLPVEEGIAAMKNGHAKIEFQNVSKTFIQKQTQRVHVLDDISLTVSENEFLIIVCSGQSGKSTRLN